MEKEKFYTIQDKVISEINARIASSGKSELEICRLTGMNRNSLRNIRAHRGELTIVKMLTLCSSLDLDPTAVFKQAFV